MASSRKERRNTLLGLAFLTPNILGVLTFVVFPVLFAIMLAFTNWNVIHHNQFKEETPKFVGLDNFVRLVFGTDENIERFYSIVKLQGDPAEVNLDTGKKPPLIEGKFPQYLGNTLFLMMAIPFGIAAALTSASMLSKDTRGGGGKVYAWLIACTILVVSCALLAAVGMGGTAMIILVTGLACGILVMGMGGGVTVYRTLFYTPHFTAGVATFLLWKKLYAPETGPINGSISPVIDKIASGVNKLPPVMVQMGMWLGFALILLLFLWGVRRLRVMWRDGDLGSVALVMPVILLCIPVVVILLWSQMGPLSTEQQANILAPRLQQTITNKIDAAKLVATGREDKAKDEPLSDADRQLLGTTEVGKKMLEGKLAPPINDESRDSVMALAEGFGITLTTVEKTRQIGSKSLAIGAGIVLLLVLGMGVMQGRDFSSSGMNGVGSGLVLGLLVMVGMFVLLGISAVLFNLPSMAYDGLEAPGWITNYEWAKPAIMLMGFWGAVGSNNMLLYLAALTNVPGELYEAADIDGAGRFQRFWNVTWPQLAPTTFFIFVMSTIGGLQGGFEMARTMTKGGPAGSTTTLSYFIYTEGFETGRLSFSAGIAWALFLLVFSVTMFNWKFGNKYVND